MVTRRFASVAMLLALALAGSLALAGCANNGSETGMAAPGPSSAGPTTSASSPASASASASASGSAETITGTVVAGVEPGCLLLQDAKGSHLLVFDDKAMRAQAPEGSKITVTGTAKPGMMTTCQQGIPFIVTSVKAG